MHNVRRATWNDVEALVDFSIALCRETEGRDLVREIVRRGIRAVLEDPSAIVLVAEDERGQVVGEIIVGAREWYEWSNAQFWWVTSVYVAPAVRRTGVARSLYAAVRELARCHNPRVIGIRGASQQANTTAHAALDRLGRRFRGQVVIEERFE
jgi:L-amino acid N-acyltransferase YncA